MRLTTCSQIALSARVTPVSPDHQLGVIQGRLTTKRDQSDRNDVWRARGKAGGDALSRILLPAHSLGTTRQGIAEGFLLLWVARCGHSLLTTALLIGFHFTMALTWATTMFRPMHVDGHTIAAEDGCPHEHDRRYARPVDRGTVFDADNPPGPCNVTTPITSRPG